MSDLPITITAEEQAVEQNGEGDLQRVGDMGELPLTVVRPSKGWVPLRLHEIVEYRELLYFLAWRDIKVRYKQTILGVIWAILQPFLTMVVFTVIFGKLAKVSSDGFPYPVFAFTALLPWELFAKSMMESGNSLVNNQALITKVYFPRVVIPMAAVLAGLVDFAIAFVVLVALLIHYGIAPDIRILALPVFLLMAVLTALAVGLWLSALNVQYRDVRYTIPFLTNLWFYATPVVYSSHIMPGWFRPLYGLNPMVGVVEGFRWAILGHGGVGPMVAVSAVVVVLMFFGGLIYFRRMEKSFADVV